jgi:hypothetical protein
LAKLTFSVGNTHPSRTDSWTKSANLAEVSKCCHRTFGIGSEIGWIATAQLPLSRVAGHGPGLLEWYVQTPEQGTTGLDPRGRDSMLVY